MGVSYCPGTVPTHVRSSQAILEHTQTLSHLSCVIISLLNETRDAHMSKEYAGWEIERCAGCIDLLDCHEAEFDRLTYEEATALAKGVNAARTRRAGETIAVAGTNAQIRRVINGVGITLNGAPERLMSTKIAREFANALLAISERKAVNQV